ncbi:ribulose-phosphate 3-epimerase [Anaerosinus massiliensis]|uniref:ribulose-phosphate 3-epimerase n=1 Tax=Massilibacillus massiliensis TaxID=1806837 RepID=UPI000A7EF3A2|nr:ribulose-phosphate 3-epimerase [Massilibacillus massiliensis]
MIIAPSLLSADFAQIKEQLNQIENSKAKWVHFDVMDGNFVKNLTFGPDILKAVKRLTSLFLDVHLVITNPAYFVDIFIDAGADNITFHVDAMSNVNQNLALIRHIRSENVKVGITMRPEVNVANYEPYLAEVDVALVMSIEPGFGGQPFQTNALERIKWLYNLRKEKMYNYMIQVDGGINQDTGKQCAAAGADILVAGSYIFKNDIKKAVDSLL